MSITTDVYDKLKEHYPKDVLGWVKEADWTLQDVPLSEINMARRPGGRNMDKVKGIAKAITDGKKMDPIFLVIQSDGSYQIADGYHRALGFKHAEKSTIKAYVANTGEDDGPWDKEMHDNKLNVEPGKKASTNMFGLDKLAEHGIWLWDLEKEAVAGIQPLTAQQQRAKQMLSGLRTKEYQNAKNIQIPPGVTTGIRDKAAREFLGLGSTMGKGLGRFAEENTLELSKIANNNSSKTEKGLIDTASEIPFDPELQQHMLQTMHGYDQARNQYEESKKLPSVGSGAYAGGFFGGGLAGTAIGALVGSRMGASIPFGLLGGAAGSVLGLGGVSAYDNHKYPETQKARAEAYGNMSGRYDDSYEAAKLNPQLWDRTRIINGMKKVPEYQSMNYVYDPEGQVGTPEQIQAEAAAKAKAQAEAIAGAIVLANHLASLRQSYSPPIKEVVQEKQEGLKVKTPETSKRTGSFTTPKQTEKQAGEDFFGLQKLADFNDSFAGFPEWNPVLHQEQSARLSQFQQAQNTAPKLGANPSIEDMHRDQAARLTYAPKEQAAKNLLNQPYASAPAAPTTHGVPVASPSVHGTPAAAPAVAPVTHGAPIEPPKPHVVPKASLLSKIPKKMLFGGVLGLGAAAAGAGMSHHSHSQDSQPYNNNASIGF